MVWATEGSGWLDNFVRREAPKTSNPSIQRYSKVEIQDYFPPLCYELFEES